MLILIWIVEGRKYAVSLTAVDSILLACEVTHLPHAPEYVLGIVNVHGQVCPVINMRRLLGLPQKEIEINDHFILAHVHQKQMALLVDDIEGVKFCADEELVSAHEVLPDLKEVEHVFKEEGQIILLYDLDKLIPAQTISIMQRDQDVKASSI